MKKWVRAIIALFAVFVCVMLIQSLICRIGNMKQEKKFEQTVNALEMMENKWQDAVPQTAVYSMIEEHFKSPLPEGKTEKKVIVIGYDGCRTDNFTLLDKNRQSAINTLLDDGGHAVFSYCGGVNYPERNTQMTSTAPGWCSMLTGVWADTHNVYKNYQPKDVSPKTLFVSLAEEKLADSSAFYVSWKGHFTKEKATYVNDLAYIKQNGINSTFLQAEDDEGTIANVLSDIKRADCSDFIFLTLEYTDHSGHHSGFSTDNPEYVEGFYSADKAGAQFIEAIKARPTYETEDWLIIITTDHGGIGKNHGGDSFEERLTFIVSNKEIKK